MRAKVGAYVMVIAVAVTLPAAARGQSPKVQQLVSTLGPHFLIFREDVLGELNPQSGAEPKQKPTRSSLPEVSLPKKRTNYQELEKVIRGLKPKKVAWREIPWRVSLIEGIKESRKTKKPIILWVFIDRPIDDERC